MMEEMVVDLLGLVAVVEQTQQEETLLVEDQLVLVEQVLKYLFLDHQHIMQVAVEALVEVQVILMVD